MTAMRLKSYPSPSGGLALGKMGVGATMLKQGKTARDYVQDGLIAMWDGIENAGWGVHDPNATTWVNLVDSESSFANINCVWHDNYCILNGVCQLEEPDSIHNAIVNESFTFEGIARRPSGVVSLFGIAVNDSTRILMPYWAYLNGLQYYTYCKLGQNELRNFANIGEDFSIAFTNNDVYRNASYFGTVQKGTTEVSKGSMYMGGYYSTSSFLWSERIYAIRFYSRALTAEEVARNYAIDKERFNLP